MWSRTLTTALVLALSVAASAGTEPPPGDLAAPVRILAKGESIDVEVGHAAPYLLDLDGDGKRDLLVGQFGGGRLRVYPNQGSETAPRYAAWTYLQAGSEDARVPSG